MFTGSLKAFYSVVLFLCCCASSHASEMAAADFLTGCWVSDDGGSKEVWVVEGGQIMFGYAFSAKAEQISFFEQLTIVKQGDKLVYLASPVGREATPFTAVEQSPGFIRFENPEHDYPQVISYKLDGDTLKAAISLMDGSKPMMFAKARCA